MVVVFGLLRPAPGSEHETEAGDEDESGRLQAALLDYGVAAIDERTGGGWRVYFHDPAERDRAVRDIGASFLHFSLRAEDVPDEDWAARSQASLRAVRVGRITVAPPWDIPESGDGIVLVILPSMGFGTGHHATTRLCLAALQRISLDRCTVLDVGTGSAVLAIAASLLGASTVAAIDDDRDAVQAAADNLELNPQAAVQLSTGDLRSTPLACADVLLANLTGALLTSVAGLLIARTAPQGCLILSGFMRQEAAAVLAAFPGCAIERRAVEDEWESVTLRRS
jgi:ribosomal protein L11 methyltransferase